MTNKRAVIKAGNDNRKKQVNGALTKWEDIIGVRSGTCVEIIKECFEDQIAIISLPLGGSSPCGRKVYRPGQKRLVPLSSLEDPFLGVILQENTFRNYA
jgi:hypothetical protein